VRKSGGGRAGIAGEDVTGLLRTLARQVTESFLNPRVRLLPRPRRVEGWTRVEVSRDDNDDDDDDVEEGGGQTGRQAQVQIPVKRGEGWRRAERWGRRRMVRMRRSGGGGGGGGRRLGGR
jgi:hypothetical protein